MTFESIIQDINNEKFAPIYLLHGDESYFIDKISKLIDAKALRPEEKSFNESILYGKDVDFKTVVDHARQFPMMAQRRLVIINEAQQMRSLKQLESYAENPSPQTVLVINHKHKKVDARLKLVKAIRKNGVVFESKKIYDNKVPAWINSYVSAKGFEIDGTASMMLGEYIGADLSRLSNEIDKLCINLQGKKITKEMVTEQVGMSKDYNVFELQKAISMRDTEKAFRIVKYFGANEKANPAPLIIGSLYGYLVKLYTAAYHKKLNDFEMQKALGLPNKFFVSEYRTAARNYSSSQILNSFKLLEKADMESKGIGARNKSSQAILEEFLIGLFYG